MQVYTSQWEVCISESDAMGFLTHLEPEHQAYFLGFLRGGIKATPFTISHLVHVAQGPDESARYHAISYLIGFGEAALPALEYLMDLDSPLPRETIRSMEYALQVRGYELTTTGKIEKRRDDKGEENAPTLTIREDPDRFDEIFMTHERRRKPPTE